MSAGDTQDKYCCDDKVGCGYRLLGNAFIVCSYIGDCIYQRPREESKIIYYPIKKEV